MKVECSTCKYYLARSLMVTGECRRFPQVVFKRPDERCGEYAIDISKPGVGMTTIEPMVKDYCEQQKALDEIGKHDE